VNDWFFCHAGNTHGMTVAQLSAELRTEIDRDGFAAPILSDPNSLLQARMSPRPWWEASSTVGLADAPPNGAAMTGEQSKARLQADLQPLGVAHLVFGHQPGKVDFADGAHRKKTEIFCGFGGMVFLIDTGMSRGVDGGPAALLKIHHDADRVSATAVFATGVTTTLWP
jgi:hypothetical protein